MSISFLKLFQPQQLTDTAAVIASVPTASTTYLLRNGRVRLTNTSATAVTVTLYTVPTGTEVGPVNNCFPAGAVPANDYVDVDLPQMVAGDALWGFCSIYAAVSIAAIDGILLSSLNTVGASVTAMNSSAGTATSSGGTVTNVSVTSANGFSASVASASSTPSITLSTTISGLLYGNAGALAAVTVGSGLSFSGGTLTATGGGTGTVTSVGLSLPADFTVSGSPVTTTGTLTAVRASQTQNLFLASPNGASGAPTYRAMVAADVPTLNQNTTGTAGTVTNGVYTTGSTSTGTQVLNGSSSVEALAITNASEFVDIIAAAPSATTNFYLASGAVQYYTTSAANNWTLNVAFSSGTTLNSMMAVGKSFTIALETTQGATAYYQTAMTIDGASVTLAWQGGTAPAAGNASGRDVYCFRITKTASATYVIDASMTQFK